MVSNFKVNQILIAIVLLYNVLITCRKLRIMNYHGHQILSDCRQLITILLADNNAGIYIRNYLFVRPT